MTAQSIAVEDVTDVEPEDSRVEAAGSEALTKEPPEVRVAAGEPPSCASRNEFGQSPNSRPSVEAEPPAVAKAGAATVKIRCNKCGKELLPKTLKYSHDCDGTKKPRQSGAQRLDEDPILEPLEPEPTPRKQRQPPPPETSSSDEEAPTSPPPPRQRVPPPDRRQTPDLRVRALMRQGSSDKPQRFAGLLTGSLPS
jgi:hypothetical protein